MKHIVTLIFYSCLSYSLISQTEVSGLISSDVFWSLDNSPYLVTGNLLVSQGSTLTIEPGVEIRMGWQRTLQVDGTLVAIGTADNNIVFTSDQENPAPGDWAAIKFTEESSDAVYDYLGNYLEGNILKNAQVLYGGFGNGNSAAVMIIGVAALIENTEIRNSQSNGIILNWGTVDTISETKIIGTTISSVGSWSSGVRSQYYNMGLSISNCLIEECPNNNRGININSTDDVSITNNKITGINSDFAIYAAGSNQTIDGNLIIDNVSGGIFASKNAPKIRCNRIINSIGTLDYQAGIVAYTNAVIEDNIIQNSGGICLGDFYTNFASDFFIVRHNQILGEGFEGTPSFKISNTSPDTINFYENLIVRSDFGASDASVIEIDNSFSSSNEINIFNNNFVIENSPNLIRNESSENVLAENNWWGAITENEMDELIIDWFDDASLGFVTYTPLLTEMSTLTPIPPVENVIKTSVPEGIMVSWLAAEEFGIEGYQIHWGGGDDFSFLNSTDVGNVSSYLLTGVDIEDPVAVTAYKYNDVESCQGSESWFSLALEGELACQNSTAFISGTVCGSFLTPSGNMLINEPGNQIINDTISNFCGLDSIITFDLSIFPIHNQFEEISICFGENYTFPDGTVEENISEPIVHTSYLQTENLCDSIIQTTLNVLPLIEEEVQIEVCYGQSYTFPDGTIVNSITEPFAQISTLESSVLCDSIVQTDIIVNSIDNSISQFGTTLVSNLMEGAYQWMYCDNDLYTPISGETNEFININESGGYAVQVSDGICQDTSSCHFISIVGINESPPVSEGILLFPNPSSGKIHLSFDQIGKKTVNIFNLSGQLISRCDNILSPNYSIDLPSKGIFIVKIKTEDKLVIHRVLVF